MTILNTWLQEESDQAHSPNVFRGQSGATTQFGPMKFKKELQLGQNVGEHIDCPWCGQWIRAEPIGGHYACPVCKRVVWDCCDGSCA